MTVIDAQTPVDAALKTVLAAVAGVTGGAHNLARPQGGVFPAIVFSCIGGEQMLRYGGQDGVERLDYDVKVIAPLDQQSGVGAILAAVHVALQNQALTVTGFTHLQTLRARRIPNYAETIEGRVYPHRGSTYSVWVSPA